MGEYTTEVAAPSGTTVPVPPTEPVGSNFTTTNCGSLNGTATGPALEPGSGYLAINGSTNLSSCIVGNNGANVVSIEVVINPIPQPIYAYIINVQGQGPAGFGSGHTDLFFTDETGDTYKLKISSSTAQLHTVQYNSSRPGIVSVQWNPS